MPPQTRRPRHKWRDKDHILLSLLRMAFENPVRDIAKIWNHVNRRTLKIEGLPHGLTNSAIHTWLAEYNCNGTGGHIFKELKDLSPRRLVDQYESQLAVIDLAASELSIRLRPKSLFALSRQGSQTQLTISAVVSLQPPSSLTASVICGPDSVPTVELSETDDRKHPQLLYRSYDPELGFESRALRQRGESLSSPPAFGSVEFRRAVWPHLQARIGYQSPFLSLAQNPHNSLRRIELRRGENPKAERHFAIFSYNHVATDASNRYGSKSGPFLARALFQKDEISSLPDGYTGVGDWLAWGKIQCPPLLVLDTNASIELAMLVRSQRPLKTLDEKVGRRLGEVLHPLSQEWKEKVVWKLLTSYGVSARKDRHGFRSFMITVKNWNATTEVNRPRFSLSRFAYQAPQVSASAPTRLSSSSTGNLAGLRANINTAPFVSMRASQAWSPDSDADSDSRPEPGATTEVIGISDESEDEDEDEDDENDPFLSELPELHDVLFRLPNSNKPTEINPLALRLRRETPESPLPPRKKNKATSTQGLEKVKEEDRGDGDEDEWVVLDSIEGREENISQNRSRVKAYSKV